MPQDNRLLKTEHQRRVEEFMGKAGQAVPPHPTKPTATVCQLRARLIMEEAMETIKALGIDLRLRRDVEEHGFLEFDDIAFLPTGEFDMVEVADGCADISVVTIGTLSACGIADGPLLREVDESNLRKFGPGSRRREDGKWLKPEDWQPPDIERVLKEQECK